MTDRSLPRILTLMVATAAIAVALVSFYDKKRFKSLKHLPYRNLSSRRPSKKTVKIYILAGDDNIEGYASKSQLYGLASNPQPDPLYGYWLDTAQGKGKSGMYPWTVLPNVFVSYEHANDKDWLRGNLTTTFGANPVSYFGPELAIGRELADEYGSDQPIVLLKAGWPRKTLHQDFVPPEEHTSSAGGPQWLRMAYNLRETIQSLDYIIRGKTGLHRKDENSMRKTPIAHYQIAGIIWWHGYSDLYEEYSNKYKKKPSFETIIETYENLLEKWIQLVPTILPTKSKTVPMVIGEMGGRGTDDVTQEELAFRKMQERVVRKWGNSYNIQLVPTALFVKTTMSTDDKAYQRYFGHAESMMKIGQAMGQSLIGMERQATARRNRSRRWFFSSTIMFFLILGTGAAYGVVFMLPHIRQEANAILDRAKRRRRQRGRRRTREEDDEDYQERVEMLPLRRQQQKQHRRKKKAARAAIVNDRKTGGRTGTPRIRRSVERSEDHLTPGPDYERSYDSDSEYDDEPRHDDSSSYESDADFSFKSYDSDGDDQFVN